MTAELLGYPVHITTPEKGLSVLKEARDEKNRLHVVTLNPEMMMQADKDTGLSGILKKAELVLPDGAGIDRFACIMAAKAWAKGNRVHIHTQSEETATLLDNLLWTYRDISFVPHEIFNGVINKEIPVTIGYANKFPDQSQVMINLDFDIPDFAPGFDRIVEIVGENETNKQHARHRYQQYKNNNFQIHDHKIENLKEYG